MTSNRTPAELARIMHDAYFDDTAAALDTYLCMTDPNAPLRDRIISALRDDIADLLHNANLDDLLPFAADLNDDDYDALADEILDRDDYLAPLADLILIDLRDE